MFPDYHAFLNIISFIKENLINLHCIYLDGHMNKPMYIKINMAECWGYLNNDGKMDYFQHGEWLACVSRDDNINLRIDWLVWEQWNKRKTRNELTL